MDAAFGVAQVIRIFGTAPFRPASGHRLVTVATGDEAPQWEVLIQVLAGRRVGGDPARVSGSLDTSRN